jgi:hypothetical protein
MSRTRGAVAVVAIVAAACTSASSGPKQQCTDTSRDVQASNYDRSCKTDSDCVGVGIGTPASARPCSASPRRSMPAPTRGGNPTSAIPSTCPTSPATPTWPRADAPWVLSAPREARATRVAAAAGRKRKRFGAGEVVSGVLITPIRRDPFPSCWNADQGETPCGDDACAAPQASSSAARR